MDSATLRSWQLERIVMQVRPTKEYLLRLRQRMTETGFPHSDPLFVRVEEAVSALHLLDKQIDDQLHPIDLGKKTH